MTLLQLTGHQLAALLLKMPDMPVWFDYDGMEQKVTAIILETDHTIEIRTGDTDSVMHSPYVAGILTAKDL